MAPAAASKFPVLLRVIIFLVIAYVTLTLLAKLLFAIFGILIASVLGAFAGAAISNSLLIRIYERGRLPDIGLHWNAAAARNLLLGAAGGFGAAALALAPPLLVGAAEWKSAPGESGGVAGFFFLTSVLLFGAVGEEMLFRGYGFQVLVPAYGTVATVLPMSVLFAAAHLDNLNVTKLALFNTFAWGVVLSFSLLRSGDLWFPIGMHFGWNWALPIFGVNVSGFTMRMTGVALEWKTSELWSGGVYGPEGGLCCTIVLAILVVFLLKAPIRKQVLPLTRRKQEAA
jgi:hypothetical protein